MIVQCPYCATRYQVDEKRFNAPNPMLKCSRCRHVFPAPGSKKPNTSTKPKKTAPAEDESLTLPFENASWKDDDGEPAAEDGDPQEGFVLGTESKVEAEEDVDPAIEEPTAPEMLVEEDQEDEEEPPDLTFGDDEESEPERRRPVDTERNAVRAVLVFLLLMIAGYGILTRALFASPVLADRLLGPLPVIGTLASDRFLARDVTLVGVQGSFQKIKEGKEVFVITGEVVSAAPITLGTIEIRGQLLDSGGKVLAEKTIYCGNVVSAKLLNDLSPRQVSVLQKMAPPKQFSVKPGASAGFVVVFMDPPKGAAELTAQVVGAQPQA
jgi:predicted Zn finger-like uncharacterized protein